MPQPRFSLLQRTWFQVAVVIGAGWYVYAPALRGSFLGDWDDTLEITDNQVLRDPAGLRKIWLHATGEDYYPLKTTVQWIQWHLWGLNPLGYHLTNLALHLLSAFLLWHVLNKLRAGWSGLYEGALRRRPSYGPKSALRQAAPLIGWIAALLFVVHPMAVESVAWVTELKSTLSLPFLLLAFSVWIDVTQASSPAVAIVAGVPPAPSKLQARTPALLYSLSLFLFLLAMLSKSSAVMFPAVILLYAWWRRGRIGWRDLAASAPFFAISLILGCVTVWEQRHRTVALTVMPGELLWQKLAVAGHAVIFYLWKFFVPIGAMPIYPRWDIDVPSFAHFLPWLALAAIAIAVILWRNRTVVFGLGWFVLFSSPVLGFVPMAFMRLSWVSDHLAYVPMLGLIGLVAAGLSKLECLEVERPLRGRFATSPELRTEERPETGRCTSPIPRDSAEGLPRRKLAFSELKTGRLKNVLVSLVLGLVILVLAQISHTYARVFSSEEALWTFSVQRNPNAWLARNDLGGVYLDEGRWAEAKVQIEAALRLNPNLEAAYNNMGNILAQSGHPVEAIADYVRANQLNPGHFELHMNLGNALYAAHRYNEALLEFQEALRLNPTYAPGYACLGLTLTKLGRAIEAQAEFDQARQLSGK